MAKKKILFVEDEAELIMLMKTRLEANGYEVVSAMDGEEGLKKVYEEKPDLVLLDLIMPKMNGLEVCRRLKNDPATKDIPVLVVTAAGLKDLDEQCKSACADGYVKKPYDPQELLNKIKSALA